jgi:MATE family multidrug resistance protein
LIGEQRAEDARRSSHASFLFSGIIQTILTVILLLCKDVLGHLFSNDEEVATMVSELIPISCIFIMGDGIQATIGGVFRGLGRQKFVLWLNILGFWVCAVPIGAVLTFVVDIGVAGLWWGFNIGIYASSAVGIWFLRMGHETTLDTRRDQFQQQFFR